MLPDTENYEEDEIQEDLKEEVVPDKTYRLNFNTLTIGGIIDEEEARRQAVLKILMTEAEVVPVYDPGYGRMYEDLNGAPTTYAFSEVKNRIKNAILQDERFVAVSFTDWEISKQTITLAIIVSCSDGSEIDVEGVEINV